MPQGFNRYSGFGGSQVDLKELEKSFWTIYAKYRSLVLPVEVELKCGDISVGTAFHIGDGYFVTARHNVEKVKSYSLKEPSGEKIEVMNVLSGESIDCDLAVLSTSWQGAQTESHLVDLHDSLGVKIPDSASVPNKWKFVSLPRSLEGLRKKALEQFMLNDFVVLGYPPIPMSNTCSLVAVKAQLIAVTSTRTNPWTRIVLSSTPRGGFSGGPILNSSGELFGICIEGFYNDPKPLETGFSAALCLAPLLELLQIEEVYPQGNDNLIRNWQRVTESTSDSI